MKIPAKILALPDMPIETFWSRLGLCPARSGRGRAIQQFKGRRICRWHEGCTILLFLEGPHSRYASRREAKVLRLSEDGWNVKLGFSDGFQWFEVGDCEIISILEVPL